MSMQVLKNFNGGVEHFSMEVLKTSNGVLKTVNGGIGRVNGGIEKGSMVALKRGIEKGNGH